MITTKGQRKRLYQSNIGYGWIVYMTGENEVTEIEIYVGRDNIVRRIVNGKPLLPISFIDEGRHVEAN